MGASCLPGASQKPQHQVRHTDMCFAERVKCGLACLLKRDEIISHLGNQKCTYNGVGKVITIRITRHTNPCPDSRARKAQMANKRAFGDSIKHRRSYSRQARTMFTRPGKESYKRNSVVENFRGLDDHLSDLQFGIRRDAGW